MLKEIAVPRESRFIESGGTHRNHWISPQIPIQQ